MSSMKNFALFAIVALSLVSLSSCSTRSDQPGRILKIGVLAPLTGEYATSGDQIKNGMELAREDLSNGGYDLTIIFEDSCFAKETLTAMTKMIEQDNIEIIGGSFCLTGFIPIIPLLEQHKIIGFNTAANPDMVLNSSYVFSTNVPIREDAKNIADFASNKLKARTAAAIHHTGQFAVDYAKYESKYFEEAGGTIVADEPVEIAAVDFRTELTKIKEKNPDVLFVTHLSSPLGTMLKQARELGINATIVSNSEAEDPNVITSAGKASEGFIVSSAEPKIKTDKMQSFTDRYTKRFGIPPTPLATNAYDAIRIQVMTYNQCNGEVECMKSALHSLKDYDGISGRITIREDGASSKPNLFKVVKDGSFVEIE